MGDIGKNMNSRILPLFLIIILFLYNIIKFMLTEGANLPIPSLLFNMILLLGFLILLIHEKDPNWKQMKLDKYLKKFN